MNRFILLVALVSFIHLSAFVTACGIEGRTDRNGLEDPEAATVSNGDREDDWAYVREMENDGECLRVSGLKYFSKARIIFAAACERDPFNWVRGQCSPYELSHYPGDPEAPPSTIKEFECVLPAKGSECVGKLLICEPWGTRCRQMDLPFDGPHKFKEVNAG